MTARPANMASAWEDGVHRVVMAARLDRAAEALPALPVPGRIVGHGQADRAPAAGRSIATMDPAPRARPLPRCRRSTSPFCRMTREWNHWRDRFA